jgi:hypothetical protein
LCNPRRPVPRPFFCCTRTHLCSLTVGFATDANTAWGKYLLRSYHVCFTLGEYIVRKCMHTPVATQLAAAVVGPHPYNMLPPVLRRSCDVDNI